MRTLAPVLVLATACTGDMALDAQHPATVTVDADGGTLHGDGVRLDVPAGAVDASVTLTAFPDTSAVQGLSTISPVWTFGPDGTQFLKPVTVRLALTTQGTAPSLWWTKAGDTSTFELLDSSVESGWAVARITHFSDGVVADGDCSCGDASGADDGAENEGDGGADDGAENDDGSDSDDDGAEGADDGSDSDDDGAEGADAGDGGADDGADGADDGEGDDDGAEGDDDGAGASCECDAGGGDDASGDGDGAGGDGEDDTDGADDPADD